MLNAKKLANAATEELEELLTLHREKPFLSIFEMMQIEDELESRLIESTELNATITGETCPVCGKIVTETLHIC